MPTLLSGPAGAGKSAEARRLLAELPTGVLIDFQTLYAAVLGILRQDDGRYPEREGHRAYALAMAEYIRKAAISGALEMDLDPIVTNSDGSPQRRQFLLTLLGAGSTERVIDPGIDVIHKLLSRDGVITQQCADAADRWYKRL